MIYTILANAQSSKSIQNDTSSVVEIKETRDEYSLLTNHRFGLSNTILSFGKDSKLIHINGINWNTIINEKWNATASINLFTLGSTSSIKYGIRAIRLNKHGGLGGVIEKSDDVLAPTYITELNGFRRMKKEMTLEYSFSKVHSSRISSPWVSKLGVNKLVHGKLYGFRLTQNLQQIHKLKSLVSLSITTEPKENEVIQVYMNSGITVQPNYNLANTTNELTQYEVGFWIKKNAFQKLYYSIAMNYAHYRKDGTKYSNILSTTISFTIQ